MTPKVWGKYAWDYIHLITMGYPDNPTISDMNNYRRYMYDTQYVLPCAICRKNFARHIQSLPLTEETLANRESFIKWGIDLHNIVNHDLGKPMLSYNDAVAYINKIGIGKTSNHNKLYLFLVVVLIVLIIFLIYYLVKKLKK